MKNERTIGVFDSGIGGLSVLKQLIRILPYENYTYLGDTARVPYGNKSDKIVNQYAEECSNFLINKNVKIIIVACNTVSSVALKTVEKLAGQIPVIGMVEPAAAAAIRSAVNGKVGIIGTRATINSNSYQMEISRIAGEKKIEISSKACPLFVPIVEEGWINHDATRKIAEDYLMQFIESGVDTLLLGCTHYPLLQRLFMEMLPGVELIDTGEHAAVATLRKLADKNLLNEERKEFIEKPNIDFYVTDVPESFHENAIRFLGFDVDEPKKIEL